MILCVGTSCTRNHNRPNRFSSYTITVYTVLRLHCRSVFLRRGIIPKFPIANLTSSPKDKPGRLVTTVSLDPYSLGADLTGRRVGPMRGPFDRPLAGGYRDVLRKNMIVIVVAPRHGTRGRGFAYRLGTVASCL